MQYRRPNKCSILIFAFRLILTCANLFRLIVLFKFKVNRYILFYCCYHFCMSLTFQTPFKGLRTDQIFRWRGIRRVVWILHAPRIQILVNFRHTFWPKKYFMFFGTLYFCWKYSLIEIYFPQKNFFTEITTDFSVK